jgi:hypothetical protein
MSNSNSVHVHVEWIVDDLLNAVKDIRAKQRFKNNLNLSIAFVLGVLGIAMLRLGALESPVFGFVAFACWMYVVILATGGLSARLNARKMFKKNPERFVPCEITLDDEGFREQNSVRDVRVPWSAITHIDESQHAFTLNLTTKQQYFLPKRVLSPEQMATVRQIFSQHVQAPPTSK